jgi:hypothetical protein
MPTEENVGRARQIADGHFGQYFIETLQQRP